MLIVLFFYLVILERFLYSDTNHQVFCGYDIFIHLCLLIFMYHSNVVNIFILKPFNEICAVFMSITDSIKMFCILCFIVWNNSSVQFDGSALLYFFYDMLDMGYYTILCRSFSTSFDSVIFGAMQGTLFIGRDYEIFMSTL